MLQALQAPLLLGRWLAQTWRCWVLHILCTRCTARPDLAWARAACMLHSGAAATRGGCRRGSRTTAVFRGSEAPLIVGRRRNLLLWPGEHGVAEHAKGGGKPLLKLLLRASPLA
jgi:hypothetical protein